MDSQKKFPLSFSFEFFPPKTEQGIEKLQRASAALAELSPCFFSVTYGAGGSTRERTFETVHDINKKTNIDVAPHIACIGSSKDQITSIINHYKDNNIRHLVALRGDIPSGMHDRGELANASDLVELIRKETGDYFFIEVAAYPEFHPEAVSPQSDLENFKRKVDAGADAALTQYFYNPDAYFYFIECCEKIGIDVPIVPGIMPITNYQQLARFSDGCGAEIPRWIRTRLEEFGDDLESIREFGEDVTSELCRILLEGGAPGLHFYTMNNAIPSINVWNNLGLSTDKATRNDSVVH